MTETFTPRGLMAEQPVPDGSEAEDSEASNLSAIPELDVSEIKEVLNPETNQWQPVTDLELVATPQEHRPEKIWEIKVHPGELVKAGLDGRLRDGKRTLIHPANTGKRVIITASHLPIRETGEEPDQT